MIHKPVHKQAAGPGCGRLVYDAWCTQQGSDEMIQSCLPSSDYINLLFYTFNFPGGDMFGLFSSIRTPAWLFSCATWLRCKHGDLVRYSRKCTCAWKRQSTAFLDSKKKKKEWLQRQRYALGPHCKPSSHIYMLSL